MEIIKVAVELTEVGCMMGLAFGLRALEVHLERREQQKLSSSPDER